MSQAAALRLCMICGGERAPAAGVRRVKVPFQIGDRVEAVVENIRGPLVNGIKNGKVVDINRWGRIRVQALPNGPHYW